MKLYGISALLCIAILSFAQESSWTTERSEIPDQYKWDTRDVYANESDWAADYQEISDRIKDYEPFRDKLDQSAEDLLNCLLLDESIMQKMGYLRLYAKLNRDANMNHPDHQVRWNKYNILESEVNKARSFIVPGIVNTPPELLNKFMEEEARLNTYAHYFESLAANVAHAAAPEREKELERIRSMTENAYTLYGSLIYSEMDYPSTNNEKGESVIVNRANSWNLRSSSQRQVRKDGYEKYYQALGGYQQTLSVNLGNFLSGKIMLAEAREFEDALDASLSRYHIPREIYFSLISSVKENAHVLQRWMRIKKQLLNVDTLYLYDIRASMFPFNTREYSWEEGRDLCIASLEAMGKEYQQYISDVYENRWIDALPNAGKETGGYSTGPGGPHPYVKMNWTGSLFDFYTLVHEFGHYVHGIRLMERQHYIYRDYPPFIGEIASTTAENISQLYLIEHAETAEEQCYFIEQYIDNIILLLFSSTIMAEFELEMYRVLEQGGQLNPKILGEMYVDILKEYFATTVEITETDKLCWLEWPHFYLDFYIFSYATSFASSLKLASDIREKGEPAVEAFYKILEAGTSEFPAVVLQKAGLDLSTPEPYQSVGTLLDQLMDELEDLL